MRRLAVFVGLFLILVTLLATPAPIHAAPGCIYSSSFFCAGTYDIDCRLPTDPSKLANPLFNPPCCKDQPACDQYQAAPYGRSDSKSANICSPVGSDALRGVCEKCFNDNGTWTAIGCIKTDPNDFLGKILGLGIGIAGGIAFILILFGGLQIMTSAGNPEQLNAGQELISSAVAGLLLIIFSIFLLKFIGINIIGIPGWTP